MKRAVVLLADGFEEVEAVTAIDFLRRADVETVIVGVTGIDVEGGHAIRVRANCRIDAVPQELDAVVIPGGAGGAANIASSAPAMELIRRADGQGRLVAAICAAPGLVLGAHDLIGTRTFTCYPGFESHVTSGSFVEDRVVVDGNLITSRGPGTAAEFALAVVRYLAGADAAADLHERTLQAG